MTFIDLETRRAGLSESAELLVRSQTPKPKSKGREPLQRGRKIHGLRKVSNFRVKSFSVVVVAFFEFCAVKTIKRIREIRIRQQ